MVKIKEVLKFCCSLILIIWTQQAIAFNLESTIDKSVSGEMISFITGELWVDTDGNGIRDLGESVVANATVRLYDNNSNLIATSATGTSGMYSIATGVSGQYYIEFEAPEGFDFTFPNLGTSDALDSDVTNENGNGSTAFFQVIDGQDVVDIDAGIYKCIPIGDLVWYDSNQNDVWDTNENGINGLLINLYRANSDTTYVKWDSQYTGANVATPSDDGYYKFCAPPGKYYVEVVLPLYGLVNVVPNVGSNEEIDNDITNAFGIGTTDSIIVVSGDEVCDLGAGYYPKAKIGNYTFIDNNINGIQDEGDEALPGVVVKLFLASGVQVGDSIITDVNGEYCFDYLGKGDYYLEFTPPPAYIVTLINQGGDDSMDSDIDNTNGPNTSITYTLNPGDTNLTVDGGFHLPVVPVEWLDLGVKNVDRANQISWSTASEINTAYFEVQGRHEDDLGFRNVGEQRAAGNSNKVLSYVLADKSVNKEGTYYYKIKQVDINGKYSFSKVISVVVGDLRKATVSVYPNPSTDLLFVDVNGVDQLDQITVSVYDTNGLLVKTKNNQSIQTDNLNTIQVDVRDLNDGMYIIRIDTGIEVVTKTLFILK